MWWKSAFIGNNFSQLCHIYCSGGGRFSPTRVTLETLKHFAGNFYILITFIEPSNNIMTLVLNEKWKCFPLIFVEPWCIEIWFWMFVRLSVLILFFLCRYQSQATWLCKKPKLAKFATNASGTNWWTWALGYYLQKGTILRNIGMQSVLEFSRGIFFWTWVRIERKWIWVLSVWYSLQAPVPARGSVCNKGGEY